jgi:multicomponent Na+:H+ antiporter subunit C
MGWLTAHYNYFVYVVLMMVGMYGMIAKRNLVKKAIGMSIFQVAIILFYVSIAVKPMIVLDPVTGEATQVRNFADIPVDYHGHHEHDDHHDGHDHDGHAHDDHAHKPAETKPLYRDGVVVPATTAERRLPGTKPPPTAEERIALAEKMGGPSIEAIKKHVKERPEGTNPDTFMNPLPHVLMLTAIVVGVSTLGVALALLMRIYKQYGTLDEADILAQLEHE